MRGERRVTAQFPARRSDLAVPPTDAANLAIGTASIVDGRRVEGPMSFADKNAMRLRELQETLVRIMRPELLPGSGARLAGGSRVRASGARARFRPASRPRPGAPSRA